MLEGLAEYDLPDVFRRLNGYEVETFSWSMKRKGKVVSRKRFDHTFASGDFSPIEFTLLNSLLIQGLGDHAAIEAMFAPAKG